MATKNDEGEGKSIAWVVAMVMLLILGGGWVYAASEYRQDVGGGPLLDRFSLWANAIEQIPNLPAVFGNTFKNRIWLPLVVIVGEVLAIGFGVFMKKIERDLNAPRRR